MGTDIHGTFQARGIDGAWADIETKYGFDRHYMLFAWLADVRNGTGFAGVITHTPLIPLQVSRGIPRDDIEREEYFFGDHNKGWLGADEIIEGARTLPRIAKAGIISIEEFRAWDGAEPAMYSGFISGPRIVVKRASEADAATTHVSVEWLQETKEELAYFVDEVKRLKAAHGDVRFLFGFDS